MNVIGRLGLVLVLLAALALGGVSLAVQLRGPDYDELISEALSDARVNELTAQGAPQQSVVNGWVARDLLAIQAKQHSDLLTQQAILGLLLALVAFGVALGNLRRRDALEDAEIVRQVDLEPDLDAEIDEPEGSDVAADDSGGRSRRNRRSRAPD